MSRYLVYGLSNGIGGVESIVMSIISQLSEYKFDIILSEGDCAYDCMFGDNVERINITPWGRSPRRFSADLESLLTKRNYDYVWVNGCLMSNAAILDVVKRNSSAKIISHSHGSYFEETSIVKKYVLLTLHYLHRNKYFRLVDVPCMCSRRSGNWFYGKKYCKTHDVYLIKNGIDVNRFAFSSYVRSRYRDELNIKKNEYLLFHAGRLTEVKNQTFIISILAELKKMGVEAKLAIAGSGELEAMLKQFAQKMDVDQYVLLLGRRSDVANLYQSADCFLLPSFHEGLPVTIIEAQTSGLPCYVSTGVTEEADVSGLVKFFDLKTTSAKEWAEAIIADMKITRNRSEYIGQICNAGYSINDVARRFMERLTCR